MKYYSYKQLEVWQRSRKLVKTIYLMTASYPKEERYSLTDQIRRSVISIPANIAEGKYRFSQKEFLRFLKISYGSGAELETYLQLSLDLGYINDATYENTLSELEIIMKMLNKLMNFINESQ